MNTGRRRSWWGWGWADEAVDEPTTAKLARSLAARFGVDDLPVRPPPRLEDATLPPSRVAAPPALAEICTGAPERRALHTYGRAYRDVVRASYGDLSPAPDLVARPRHEADVIAVLDWCATHGYAAIPFGGGSSVVGGVECRERDLPGVVSIDLTALDRVIEIDRVSRAARIQGGTLGPVLEDQLRPHGLTLRHFPQSFEFSTLGGWLATRSGGHYASVLTHIDDLTESIRLVTPTGVSESRRLPGSGAGPSPDALVLGSEGALGIITEAWMRLQDRPRWKASAGVRFGDWNRAVDAVRVISQSGLNPANCRLLDPLEAALSAGVEDGSALLVLGFESADHPFDAWIDRAVEIALDHGGRLPDGVVRSAPQAEPDAGAAGREGSVGAWRSSFLRAPYTRDALVRMSVIVETFETACTWDRFSELHASVTDAVTRACGEVAGAGMVSCRFTHVYPDGPAPYFTVYALGSPGDELAAWDEIKAASAEALLAAGGTITHHHAVGRDHLEWYRRQRPTWMSDALAATKATLDPTGICNPGVLV